MSVPSHSPTPARPAWPGAPRHRATPTAATARALGPDVARGFMLLFIALANTTLYLYGSPDGLLFRPVEAGTADRVVDAIGAVFIDNRAYPMFAFLFAYGIHQLTMREQARGATWPQTRNMLLQRNGWLFAIGAAHAVLLFYGDIITTYAIAGFALVLLVRAPRWVLWLVFGLSMLIFVPVSVSDAVYATEVLTGTDAAGPAVTAPTFLEGYVAQLLAGLGVVAASPLMAFTMLAPMTMGLLAARIRILERPWEHVDLAYGIAIGGIALGVVGGIPFAGAFLTGYEPSYVWLAWGMVHGVTGLAAGPAYAVAISLAVSRTERRRLDDPSRRPAAPLRALSALGRRSMSGYVAQSVCYLVLFPAWTLGLGGVLGTAGAALVAIAVWLVTLVGAVVLDRFDAPGPLEWVLRRLTYGKRHRRTPKHAAPLTTGPTATAAGPGSS